jgi:spore coat protein CotF
MSYKTNKTTKKKIDNLLSKNASYQAANVCVTNSKTKRQEINRHCRVNFINPIKDIDPDFYKRIILN